MLGIAIFPTCKAVPVWWLKEVVCFASNGKLSFGVSGPKHSSGSYGGLGGVALLLFDDEPRTQDDS